MAERVPVITYKKSRRTIKFWDTVYLYENMQEAINVRATLEQAAEEKDCDIDDIGNIAIPSDVLYRLADALIHGYEKLLKEGLIKSGNISKIQPTLN